jgi:hypothetical protein
MGSFGATVLEYKLPDPMTRNSRSVQRRTFKPGRFQSQSHVSDTKFGAVN